MAEGKLSATRATQIKRTKLPVVGCRVTALTSLSAVLCENRRSRNLFQNNAPASSAEDINDLGQVVGYAQKPLTESDRPTDVKRGAFCWEQGKRRYLEVPSGYRADKATAINNAGEIVGNVRDAKGKHAVIWRGDSVSLLGEPDEFRTTEAIAVNDVGQILVRAARVEWAELSKADRDLGQNLGQQSFLWQGGQWQAIHDIGLAHSLNNQGQLVGWVGLDPGTSPGANSTGDVHAALWEAGIVTDLNDVTTEAAGWELQSAEGINNRGQIVGNGIFERNFRAFLLTPLP